MDLEGSLKLVSTYLEFVCCLWWWTHADLVPLRQLAPVDKLQFWNIPLSEKICASLSFSAPSLWHDWNRRLGNLSYLESSPRSWHCPKQSRDSNYTLAILFLFAKTAFDWVFYTFSIGHTVSSRCEGWWTSINQSLRIWKSEVYSQRFWIFLTSSWRAIPSSALCYQQI